MFVFDTAGMSGAQLQERVDEIVRGLSTPVRGAEPDFGQRLKQTIQHRLSARNRITATSASSSSLGEDFGDKVRDVVSRHPNSQQSHRERVEQERSRYRKSTQRKPSKSD